MADECTVEVVFALADRQVLIEVRVPDGTTVADTIRQSGIAQEFPDHDLSSCSIGIWGRLVDAEHVVASGDRIEIYRELAIDPRDARRKLAAQGKFMGRHADGD